jgi:hypothetical protein
MDHLSAPKIASSEESVSILGIGKPPEVEKQRISKVFIALKPKQFARNEIYSPV